MIGMIPGRKFIDDLGRQWEWCGGQPGTWAWRLTALPCEGHSADLADHQPIGEYPPIDMYDLVPIERKVRALVAVQLACEALSSFIGVDLLPGFTDDFATILRLPPAASNI